MFHLIYELYFFLYYFLLSFFMIIDHNSIESSHNTSSITSSHSHPQLCHNSKNDIVIEIPENVYSKKNKDDINCTLLDLDYLENNYILCDYKENLIEV